LYLAKGSDGIGQGPLWLERIKKELWRKKKALQSYSVSEQPFSQL
jgi:hypothetical protein